MLVGVNVVFGGKTVFGGRIGVAEDLLLSNGGGRLLRGGGCKENNTVSYTQLQN